MQIMPRELIRSRGLGFSRPYTRSLPTKNTEMSPGPV